LFIDSVYLLTSYPFPLSAFIFTSLQISRYHKNR